MKRLFPHVCAALFALMVLCSVTTRAADNVYAILYDDGTFVFQHGNTPKAGKTVTKTYEVDLNEVYEWDSGKWAYNRTPWYNERQSIRVVNFADKIRPGATAYWFYECNNLKRVDNIRNLDTANVKTMCCMFAYCSGLTALDVSHFDTANVTDMSHMFQNCCGLTALDVSHFNTANVTKMHSMFCDCSGLTTLNLSTFDTANVTDMLGMFDGCSNLKTIYASDKFITASVTYDFWMFYRCTSLVGGNGTKYDENHFDGTYARIDTPSAPGYFTASKPNPEPEPEPETTYVITSYAGEGGSIAPKGDTRVSVGGTQKYVMTPNPGYRVLSVRMDGMEIGALSEYVFENVIRDHSIVVSFEPLPRYAITSAVAADGELSVTLENSGAVIVAVSYFGKGGQFLSADLQSVSANIGKVTFAVPLAYKARVALFDSDCRPLCDPVTVR